ncbi:uncharacterized protein LOC113237334 isoform X2 [Hyposmocoma kahamanoa]|uniref:uncharacterized protein LOC113237334 isoform X2 n=1 Tax=Hyposmocoma kahamanoa TaxID=1477025 RepID=UPI000E6D8ACD|nr:uncharacterized protein LOC113237334 isoform X2 [Hyposmocoma kahamanoa]
MVDLINDKSTPKDEVSQSPALMAEFYVEPVLKNDVNKLILKDETYDQTVLKVEAKDETVLKATTTQGISPKPTMSTSVCYKLSADTRPEHDVFTSECRERCGILKTRRSRVTRSPAF